MLISNETSSRTRLLFTFSHRIWRIHMVTCAYFALKSIPKRELIYRTPHTHTASQTADSLWYYTHHTHCHSASVTIYFFCSFFCRWIFLGYLGNLFVWLCVCMSVASIRAYYNFHGVRAAHMFWIIQIPIKWNNATGFYCMQLIDLHGNFQ